MLKSNNKRKNPSRVTKPSIVDPKLAPIVLAVKLSEEKPAKVRLANLFIEELIKVLTPAEFCQINTINRFNNDDSCCATHEFCDPNECMAEAFIKAFGCDIMPPNNQHMKIANEAWLMAKKNKFFKIK